MDKFKIKKVSTPELGGNDIQTAFLMDMIITELYTVQYTLFSSP